MRKAVVGHMAAILTPLVLCGNLNRVNQTTHGQQRYKTGFGVAVPSNWGWWGSGRSGKFPNQRQKRRDARRK